MGKTEMNKDLLAFELDQDKDQLFIHGDPGGLRRLANLLLKIADLAEKKEFPHEHLFTKRWGGEELSSKPQESGHECLNHVKIHGWPDKDGAIPYKKSI